MSKPRILIFSTAYFPYVGGAEIAIKEITSRLPDYEWHLVTPRYDSKLAAEETLGQVRVYRTGNGSFWDKQLFPFQGWRLGLRLHKAMKFSALWSMEETRAGYATWRLHQKTGLPYLLSLQSGSSDTDIRRKTLFWGHWYRQIHIEATQLQAISNFLAVRAKRYGFSGRPVIIPNGVDVKHFGRAVRESEQQALRQKLGCSPADIIVISVSRLVKKNGLSDLIKSIPLIAPDLRPRLKLVIVGTGAEQVPLEALVADLGISSQVVFTGYAAHENLPVYLSLATIFCRPSLSEGLGNAFLEAMAAGVPVIGSPVGGIVDFLTDGHTGLLCQPNDPASIAAAVEIYLREPEVRERLRSAAKELVEKKYDWDIQSEKFRALFGDLIPAVGA